MRFSVFLRATPSSLFAPSRTLPRLGEARIRDFRRGVVGAFFQTRTTSRGAMLDRFRGGYFGSRKRQGFGPMCPTWRRFQLSARPCVMNLRST